MQRWTRANYQPVRPLGEDGRVMTESREHRDISRRAARAGMVLLKNEEKLLPFAEGTKIALFGKATIDYVKGGGGSGDTTVREIMNIADGFEKLDGAVSLFPDTVAFYRDYVAKAYADGGEPPRDLEILHESSLGRLRQLILRGKSEELEAKIAATQPLFMDVVPLSLEEIFIYELGGAGHELTDMVL